MDFTEKFKEICRVMGFNYDNLLPSEIRKINEILNTIYSQGYEDGKPYHYASAE